MNGLIKTCLALMFVMAMGLIGGCNGASDRALSMIGTDGSKVGFNYRMLTRGNHARKFGTFVPVHYDPAKKYPVIIFLQGVGEGAGMGEGDGKNMTVGLGPFVALQHDNFDFIVLFVQSSGGWDANSEYADDVITALDTISKEYNVDQDRVSLTGLSTGGYGTYVIGARFNDRFSAIVPMGSNGKDESVAPKLAHMGVRAYCSESGDIFAGSNDSDMVKAINRAGGRAEFIQTPTAGHDCWEYVYGGGELFSWLKAQHRTGGSAATPAMTPHTVVPITGGSVSGGSSVPVNRIP